MGILDQVVAALGTSAESGRSGTGLMATVQGVLGTDAAQGMSGLMQKFEAAGLANVIQSWIGTGANLPISPDQLQSVLGAAHLDQLAQSAGLNKDQLLANLSQTLPGVIDTLTPGGQMPASDTVERVLKHFNGGATS